jgi:hypothetical protein
MNTDLGNFSSEILPPELDPAGRISFVNMNSFSDFAEKYHDREDLDLFKKWFIAKRNPNCYKF